MSKIEALINLATSKEARFDFITDKGGYRFMSDEAFLKKKFEMKLGYPLNLENPQTFNEKLQWLKLHDRRPEYTTMVDKYAAKQWVADRIGGGYIIPTLGVWEHFDEIDFDKLPDQFVLKCTHDSGGLVIVKDKSTLDRKAAKKKIEKCLKRNFYYAGREWPYKNVPPRIIAEPYLTDESGMEPKDYKIFNFDGEPKVIQVDYERFKQRKSNLYSAAWEYLDVINAHYPHDPSLGTKAPDNLNEMLRLARILSAGIPHLRTDFYNIENRIFVGELTFYHGSGFDTFTPESFTLKMGSWITLPGGGYLFTVDNIVIYIHPEEIQEGLTDYKIFNFDGEPRLIQVDYDRFVEHKRNLYSTDWQYIEATFAYPSHPDHPIDRPKRLEEMLNLARTLSQGIPYVRTDFYCINDRIYFGELTFYPESGIGRFDPEILGAEMGKWIKLPRGGGYLFTVDNIVIYMHPEEIQEGLTDYKIFNFDGEPKLIQVDFNRFTEHRRNLYSTDWQYIEATCNYQTDKTHQIEKPKKLAEMLELASKLSAGYPHVRTDFYIINDKVLFGKLTLYHSSGWAIFTPPEFDKIIGQWLSLPSERS